MSEYFSFYLGRKQFLDDKKFLFSIIGPFFKNKDGDLKLRAVYSRSRSFIDNDIVDYFKRIEVNEMDETLAKIGTLSDFSSEDDKKCSMAWVMSLQELYAVASYKPVTGYVLLEDYDEIMGSNADDSMYMPKPVSSEYYCGLPEKEQNKYAHVSYVSRYSIPYVFNCVAEGLAEAIDYDTFGNSDDLCIIMIRG